MLRFAEEILLLLCGETAGDLAFVPEPDLHHTLAGAVLMDLAQENRIDTDLDQLVVIDATPLDDELLDPTLARIVAEKKTRDALFWVRRVATDGDTIRTAALERLLAANILQAAEGDEVQPSPQVARAHRYPAVDGEAEQEVRLRIMGTLFADDIPTPRDVVLICLADACGMFQRILSKAELAEARERIDLMRRLDLIGQAVARAVRESREQEAKAPAAEPKKIPIVKGLPLIGSALDAAGDFRAFVTRKYLQLGPVFEVRLLHRKALVLAGPEVNRFANKRGREHFSSQPWIGFAEGMGAARLVLNMDGAEHAAMRKALASGFSRRRFHDFLGVASDIARERAAGWPRNQRIQPLLAVQQIIADQMGEVLAGEQASAHLRDMVDYLETLLITRATRQMPQFLFARRFNRAHTRLQALAERTLQSHRPGGRHEDADDFINDLLDLHHADPQFFPETDMRAMALAPYLVGIETVATSCAFTLYAILKHPDLLRRIQAEVDEFFAGPTTVERLRQLDVTHRTVLEALRMYPVGVALFRTVANSFDLAGHHVAAGQRVYVVTSVTHRLPEFFPEPDRFDIDRYLPERAEHRQPYAYAPFGLGTHRCLGGGFAEAQMLLTVAAILHTAELRLTPPGYELKITNVPVPRPNKRFRFQMTGLRHSP